MAETFIETAKLLLERQPQLQFLVPLGLARDSAAVRNGACGSSRRMSFHSR
jgi:hypothetical protein